MLLDITTVGLWPVAERMAFFQEKGVIGKYGKENWHVIVNNEEKGPGVGPAVVLRSVHLFLRI